MWYIYLIIFLITIKVYNKFMCGKCLSETVMTGKVVIVTGANSGIGYETAKDLARRGAKVILACRNEKLGNEAREKIVKYTKNDNVVFMKLDLSSLDSIRSFVRDFLKSEAKLDVLVNNAGAASLGNKYTKDGIVNEMQVNYFGPFLLTVLLVPLLKKTEYSRVVNVSSVLHYFGRVNLKKINAERAYYDLQTYSNSKLCNVLFSNELARRLENTTVSVNSLHPGHIRTNIYKNRGGLIEIIMNFVLSTWFKNAVEGAQTSIYVAVSEECDEVTGKYFVDCSEARMSSKALDKELAAKLWKFSEELVKLKPHEIVGE